MPRRRPRILFVYQAPSSFVREDLRILSDRYEVVELPFGVATGSPSRKLRAIGTGISRQVQTLYRELPDVDLIFGWFADYHMALPVLAARVTRKPVVVVLGGTDCVRLPEYGYGVFDSRWRAPLARFVHRNATMLLPVTEALIEMENTYSNWPQARRDGVRIHVPGFSTPYAAIPTGYDPVAWPPGPPDRERVVGTAALLSTPRTFYVKGIDVFVDAARLMPDVLFRIVGVEEKMMAWFNSEMQPPTNVVVEPARERRDLIQFYHECSVYAQLSRSEGLPNVLCEAMLCGCIPVGSNVGGIPDAIGSTGYVTATPEPGDVAKQVQRALEEPKGQRKDARKRVQAHFSMKSRSDAITNLIEHLVYHELTADQ